MRACAVSPVSRGNRRCWRPKFRPGERRFRPGSGAGGTGQGSSGRGLGSRRSRSGGPGSRRSTPCPRPCQGPERLPHGCLLGRSRSSRPSVWPVALAGAGWTIIVFCRAEVAMRRGASPPSLLRGRALGRRPWCARGAPGGGGRLRRGRPCLAAARFTDRREVADRAAALLWSPPSSRAVTFRGATFFERRRDPPSRAAGRADADRPRRLSRRRAGHPDRPLRDPLVHHPPSAVRARPGRSACRGARRGRSRTAPPASRSAAARPP